MKTRFRRSLRLLIWPVLLLTIGRSLAGEPQLIAAQSSAPRGLALDRWGDVIFGQPDFTEVTMNETSADRVFSPGGLLLDESFSPARLWLWDANSRLIGLDLSNPLTEDQIYRARVVIGQPSPGISGCNADSSFQFGYPIPSAATLCAQTPTQISISEGPSSSNMDLDSRGRLYVADNWNNRVLVYDNPWHDQVADRVWGQSGFNQGINLPNLGCNRGSISQPRADSLCFYTDHRDDSGYENGIPGVHLDPNDNLWVADPMNHRVLRFPRGSDGYPAPQADLVLGQYSFTARDPAGCWEGHNGRAYDPFMLCRPAAVLVDSSGRVIVADAGRVAGGPNDARYYGRVVVYEKRGASWIVAAVWDGDETWVPGAGDRGPINPASMGLSEPTGLAFDPDGNIWVTDSRNNQVLLLDRSSGALLNVLGHSKPTWQIPPGTWDDGQNYGDGVYLRWKSGHPNIHSSVHDAHGNVASFANRDVLVAAWSVEQNVYLFPISRFPSDSKALCHDFKAGYPWYDPDCRPYVAVRLFNRTQFAQMNKITPRSLGNSIRLGYAPHADQLLIIDNRSLKIWSRPAQQKTNYSDPIGVWARSPLVQVDGDLSEWPEYSGLGVDDDGSQDAVWLSYWDGGSKHRLALYTLPLQQNNQPLALLEPPLPVLGGGTLSLGWVPSIAASYTLTPEGHLWIADVHNHRVLRIRNPRFNPLVDVIIGQAQLGGTECNQGRGMDHPTASTLCNPGTVKLDAHGNLYVGDHFLENWGNGRILEYDARHFSGVSTVVRLGTAADRVFFTNGDFQKSGVFCGQLNSYGTCAPMGFTFDENGFLYVGLNPYASGPNYYPRVWFNPLGDWRSPPDARIEDLHSMALGLAADGQGNVYIHDHNRNRIVRYNQPWGFQAKATFGQACEQHESADVGIHNPHNRTVNVRLVWLLQDRSHLSWHTFEETAAIQPQTTFRGSHGSVGLNLIDVTVSSENAAYKSLHVSSENRCESLNQPPTVPTVSGPNSGEVGLRVEFRVSSQDPDHDQIRYIVDWGDGEKSIDGPAPSAASVVVAHAYQAPGEYQITVLARDVNGGESARSAPHPMAIRLGANHAPTVPQIDAPGAAAVGELLTIRARSTDPENERIRYTFDWGDGSTSSSTYGNSGVWMGMYHVYHRPGQYSIRLQAIDQTGNHSAWSTPWIINVGAAPDLELLTTEVANTFSYFGRASMDTLQAQSFKAIAPQLCRASVALARNGSPSADIAVDLRADLHGSSLASAAIAASQVVSANYLSPTWAEIEFPGCVPLTRGATYFLVLSTTQISRYHYYHLPLNRSNPYPDGSWFRGTGAEPRESFDILARLRFAGGGTSPTSTPAAPTPTIRPGEPTPTRTSVPTYTAVPTNTAVPTHTAVPTQTPPAPTNTAPPDPPTATAIPPTSQANQLELGRQSSASWSLGSRSDRMRAAQSFSAIGTRITGASIALQRVGLPARPILVSLRSSLSGSVLGRAEIDPSQLGDFFEPRQVTVTFTNAVSVRRGSTYFLVLESQDWNSGSYFLLGYDENNPYRSGYLYLGNGLQRDSDMVGRILFAE